jgi:hypothetical protein
MASAYAAAEMGRLLRADARMAPDEAGSARGPRRRASIDLRMDGTRQPLAALRDACVQVRRAAPRARPRACRARAQDSCADVLTGAARQLTAAPRGHGLAALRGSKPYCEP